MDTWRAVEDERRSLAALLATLDDEQWATPSLCGGWRVGDVAGHLVHLAEATHRSTLSDLAGDGWRPNQMLDRAGRRIGRRPPAELAARLEAAASGRFVVPGVPKIAALGEVLTHGLDLRIPLSLPGGTSPDHLLAVLRAYRRFGPAFGMGARALRVRVVATDLGWAAGRGPEVRGPGASLLLALAGRDRGLDGVEGRGVAVLRRPRRAR